MKINMRVDPTMSLYDSVFHQLSVMVIVSLLTLTMSPFSRNSERMKGMKISGMGGMEDHKW